jgi:hypothetical protein
MNESLERTVQTIFREVCIHEERDLQASAITGERILAFERLRRRNLRFGRAQILLIKELRSTIGNQQRLKSAIKVARRNRDKASVNALRPELKWEGFKETIFRSLANCIAWQLIDGRVDIARHLDISEPTRPNLDSSNVISVTAVAEVLNQNNPLSFALVSDLTSFVQIGDLLRRDVNSPILSVIEVKEGEKNVQAIELLGQAGAGNLNLDEIALTHGETLMKQVRRMQRQRVTRDQAREIINSGKGVDPVSGLPVWVPEKVFYADHYDHAVANSLTELDERMRSYAVIEKAVLVGCYTSKMKRVGYTILHSIAEQEFKQNFVVVNFGPGSLTARVQPVFMKPFREKDIFDIVFDRTRIYIAIGLDLILEMFKERGYDVRWASKRETAKLLARPEEVKLNSNRNYKLFTAEGRALAISNSEVEMYLGDALVTRLAYDNMVPSSFIRMSSQSLEQIMIV